MVTPTPPNVINAKTAAELALITYRQLDHWARQGWVTPSVQSATGRGKRREYSPDDVLRLAALRHFAKSGWAVTDLGDLMSDIDVSGAAWILSGTTSGLSAVSDNEALHQLIGTEEQFSAYHLEPLRSRLYNNVENRVDETTDTVSPLRRLA